MERRNASNAARSESAVSSVAEPGRGARPVVDEDVDPAEALDRLGHDPLARLGDGEVGDDRQPAEPLGLEHEPVAAARDHRHLHPLGGERLGAREPDPRGGAADDGDAAGEAELHRYFRFRTLTTSATAAAEALTMRFSSALSFSFTTSSTPPAPSLAGTPM